MLPNHVSDCSVPKVSSEPKLTNASSALVNQDHALANHVYPQ